MRVLSVGAGQGRSVNRRASARAAPTRASRAEVGA
jgi:hypothetical protein